MGKESQARRWFHFEHTWYNTYRPVLISVTYVDQITFHPLVSWPLCSASNVNTSRIISFFWLFWEFLPLRSTFHCPSFHSLETSSAVNSGRGQPSVSLFKISYNCILLCLCSFSGPFCSLRFVPLLASAQFVCWCFDWCLLGTAIFPLCSDSARPWPRTLLLPVTNSTLSNTSCGPTSLLSLNSWPTLSLQTGLSETLPACLKSW